ncbi:MAG: hypothetical protein HQM10_09275 [Candidatus Riflebacteria bacterium]|nr:hypothetical protein [Candidatus Riflebacteria bacterium]
MKNNSTSKNWTDLVIETHFEKNFRLPVWALILIAALLAAISAKLQKLLGRDG